MHDGCPTACVGDAAFGYVAAFRDHVNVGFFFGALLQDPARPPSQASIAGSRVPADGKRRMSSTVDPPPRGVYPQRGTADLRDRVITRA
jgi:hypothetical protein